MPLFSRKKNLRIPHKPPVPVPTARSSSAAGQDVKIAPPQKQRNTRITRLEPVSEPEPIIEQTNEEEEPNVPKQPTLWQRFVASVDWGVFRIRLVFSLFAVVFLILWGRAWYLQMLEGPKLAERARRQHITSEVVSGKRGMILSGDGQVLARSVEALSVYANPPEIRNYLEVANTLGPILGIAPQKLFDQLSNSKRRFEWLKRKVDDYTADAVRNAKLDGIGLSKEYERVYPFKHMAGQLLGFVGYDDKGLEGLERALQKRLASEPQRQYVQRDATGRKFYLREEGQEDPHGEDVQLTLDIHMQFIAEEEVAKAAKESEARWAGALVVHVPTGEILAWAQYPFFNPNTFQDFRPSIYRNRLAQDALEPGSTLKPLIVAAALQERKVNRNTVIYCEKGRWETKYATIRDTSIRADLPIYKIIRYSSNIGMSKIGLMLGPRTMYRYLNDLGFGERTTVPVAESSGILRAPRHWSEVDCMSIAFGQAISVTGLQLAQAYLTMLSGGVTRNLTLIKDDPHPPVAKRQHIFSESVTREVRRMMRDVVEAKDGTGRRAAIEGISVGGKTGTAQKADRRSGSYGSKRLASFVGFLPVEKPIYLILVFIDEPQRSKWGGVIAAPVFKEIAQRIVAYAGILDGKGHLKPEPDALVKAEKSKQAQVRGFKVAALESPFEKKTKPKRLKLERPSTANPEKLSLTGHLAKASATVPNVQGKTVRNAVELFARAGIVPIIKGTGVRVVRQSPAPGTPWPEPVQDAQEAEGAKSAPNVEYILWLSEK